MKRIVMLALLVVGTAGFANAKTVTVKKSAATEISSNKHKKALRKAKRVQATPTVTATTKK